MDIKSTFLDNGVAWILRLAASSASSAAIYLLRTQHHQIQLSIMADQKANFLLAAYFVTLSIMKGDGKTH